MTIPSAMLAIWLLVLGAGCAKVAPPSGGPVDRQPPSVRVVMPSADALNVALDTHIELTFSEPMERQRTEEALFVTPETRLRFDWKGRRLRLVLDGGLRPDRTYVVTVGTGARDLRGNALDESFTLAFATGPRLNQGRIKGMVYQDHAPVSAAHIWAYDLAEKDSYGLPPRPSYRTQSGRDGAYEFSRLAAGRYRLLAFADENRNQQYDADEALALAAADVVLGEDEEALAGDLALAVRQDAAPRLQRAETVHSRRLLLQFTAAVDAAQIGLKIKNLAVEAVYNNPQDKTRVYVGTGPQEAGLAYRLARLEVNGVPIKWGEAFRGSGRLDRSAPKLVARHPDGGLLAAGDSLRLFFNESMVPAVPRAGWNADRSHWPDPDRPVNGQWQWTDAATLAFIADRPYAPGEYRLALATDFLTDQAGLALVDSVLVIEFEVPRALGRITGQLSGSGSAAAWVTAQRQDGRQYRSRSRADGTYLIDQALPGEYIVFAFADLDDNGAQGFGRRKPWQAAEPYVRRPESVALKAGETQDGIDLELK